MIRPTPHEPSSLEIVAALVCVLIWGVWLVGELSLS